MPSRARKQAARVVRDDDDDVSTQPGSGQSAASHTAGLSAQPALLAAAAAAQTSTPTSQPTTEPATSATKKKKKRSLSDIEGFDDLASGGGGGSGGGDDGSSKRREKPIEAVLKLATHQRGEKKGQLSGRVYYAINPAYDDNARLKEVILSKTKQKARFFSDWSKWAVLVPTAALALDLHAAIRADKKMKVTARKINLALDVSAFDNQAVEKFSFVLAESESQFETRADGLLPRSILLIGKTFPFKEHLKEKFEAIRYLDLIFNGGTVVKSGWVLPVSAQTEATGTLADYLRSLGAKVSEEDLDEGEDDSEEDDERDDEALVDGEADEADEDNDDE